MTRSLFSFVHGRRPAARAGSCATALLGGLLGALLLMHLPGCSEEAAQQDRGAADGGAADATGPTPDGSLARQDGGGGSPEAGGAACGPGIYPCGPYGVLKGSVIENHKFQGYMDPQEHCKPDANKKLDTSRMVPMMLQDWYQGDSACPASKKKLLWILGSAAWCGTCIGEAKSIQAAYAADQVDKRVAFLNVLVDGKSYGNAPSVADTNLWATSLGLSFPVAMDANREMIKYFTASGFPVNILVDLADMKIYYARNGDSVSTIGQKIADFFAGVP